MFANISVKDPTGGKKFLAGNIVFKITSIDQKGEKIHGMVTTKEEYEKKLSAHMYISILHVAPLTYRLAYLFDCLNREKGVPRTEVFIFWHRAIGKQEWTEWFAIHPYVD